MPGNLRGASLDDESASPLPSTAVTAAPALVQDRFMPIDPHRLLVLRAVHRTGSVAAAAAALHLTASGVSQHLTRLESETRLALLDRTRRGGGRAVTLTTAGLALAERADDVARALADAQREADRLRDGAQGTVRVGGFSTALGRLVVPALLEIAVSDPALHVQVLE